MTISVCQQIVVHSEFQIRILLLAIKLGIAGSKDAPVALLFEYEDKATAEDYLNCGCDALADGARQWASANGYEVMTGLGGWALSQFLDPAQHSRAI